ncbi:ras-related protein Rab-39B-like [Balaenoptera musculus]|uniref:Ras-related protein Rab-39B-like n=1 Tax=Balaenoptera musculus TaxID=9771 RepID=A0A8B8XDZ4_BALMU|nr:ras-related protein Rab-39B-like [Balaenoptera musculus]
MDPLWQYQFHILLLGDSNVDKPSLLRNYVEGIFVEGVAQAVAVDFSVPFMEAEPGGPAGQERSPPTPQGESPPIRKRSGLGGRDKDELWTKSTGTWQEAFCGLVITNRTSFESVPQRHREVLEKAKPSNILFLVVGHKSDLVVEGEVMPGGGEKLAASWGAHYVETSAESNSDISTAFKLLTQEI